MYPYLAENDLIKVMFYYCAITTILFSKLHAFAVRRMGNVLSSHLNERDHKKGCYFWNGMVGTDTGAVFPTLYYPGSRHAIPTVAFPWKFYLKILLTVDKCSEKCLDIRRPVDVTNGEHYIRRNFQIDNGHLEL